MRRAGELGVEGVTAYGILQAVVSICFDSCVSLPSFPASTLTEAPAINHPFVKENGQVGKEDPSAVAQDRQSAQRPETRPATSSSIKHVRNIEYRMYRSLSGPRLFNLAFNIFLSHVGEAGGGEGREGAGVSGVAKRGRTRLGRTRPG